MREVSSRICRDQPSTTGVPNRPMAMENASTAPDRMAGATSGSVMRAALGGAEAGDAAGFLEAGVHAAQRARDDHHDIGREIEPDDPGHAGMRVDVEDLRQADRAQRRVEGPMRGADSSIQATRRRRAG